MFKNVKKEEKKSLWQDTVEFSKKLFILKEEIPNYENIYCKNLFSKKIVNLPIYISKMHQTTSIDEFIKSFFSSMKILSELEINIIEFIENGYLKDNIVLEELYNFKRKLSNLLIEIKNSFLYGE